MTISKERFEQLSLDTASDLDSEYGLGARTTGDWPIKFAHALLKKVEAESDKSKPEGYYRGGAQYLRLPLVSEE
jgi:hypothetical protein